LDAVQVNTPDHLHRAPTVHSRLERGLDVLVPKPLAESIADAHEMVATARQRRRLLGGGFPQAGRSAHSRGGGPLSQPGRTARFQLAVWYMLDKLLVADPNHAPRFFASADFAERNSPISFLTVHMVDAFLQIIREKPTHVRATAYAQKLPSLAPIAVDGYDVCDTEVVFESGGVAHILTGWHLPNTAHALTVQSSRIICTEGIDRFAAGCNGLPRNRRRRRESWNATRCFATSTPPDTVSGYGIEYPGELYRKIMRFRAGDMDDAEYARMMGSLQLGYWTTVVCEARTPKPGRMESRSESASGSPGWSS
jgi:predicted dehydrogenase